MFKEGTNLYRPWNKITKILKQETQNPGTKKYNKLGIKITKINKKSRNKKFKNPGTKFLKFLEQKNLKSRNKNIGINFLKI
jgi:hypothetical protein